MDTFDSWYEYHKQHKNWANTPEQLARWAWAQKQLEIDAIENDLRSIAQLLNIDPSINPKSLRFEIIKHLSNENN